MQNFLGNNKVIYIKARIADRVDQLDALVKHTLRHNPVFSGHRCFGMSEDKAELLIQISRTPKRISGTMSERINPSYSRNMCVDSCVRLKVL